MPFSAMYFLAAVIASFTVNPFKNPEFIMIPSLASQLSSLTSQPSISGMIGKLKCFAKA